MKNFIVILISLFSFNVLNAQNCVLYFPDTEGTKLSYNNFDKKGALSGSHTQKLTKLNSSSDGLVLEIETEAFDKKGKELSKGTMEVTCRDNVFYFNMEKYIAQSTAGFQDMDIEVESENMEMPGNMKAGDKLKDAWVKATISNSGYKVMSLQVNIINRKVEAEETISTKAGSFKCLKISQTIETKSVMTIVMESVEWYSVKTGLIKSETYSNGKVMASSELVAIN